MTSPPAALLALHGRRLDSLTPSERAVFQRFRNGRPKQGRPWISVGLSTSMLDASALLSAPTQTQADEILKQAGAVICVRIYD